MLDLIRQQQKQEGPRRLTFNMARSVAEIAEAQRIRFKVFGEEMGANLPSAEMGLDIDRFDEYCDHLLVRDHGNDKVVGTYRILPPEQAVNAGGYYSETEFDLSRLENMRDRMVEVGRSCVHPDYRDGATITQLWSGLADYIGKHNHEYLIGCASISMADGGHYAASVYNKVHRLHAAPSEYTVFPHCRLPLESLNRDLEVAIPPLIKGYLRLGAYIAGEPAWDPEFNCADLFILMPVSRMNARYAKHFLRKAA
ncbi:MAG: GNAT family N-acetyltransferase [Gammaproteobacteria bacterium]|jgi:putative hemolysin|nr:GNAT family N-acetyltransferase [Gammaproteobacteria bacterium]MBU1624834.1 GNAT family N-acetyltransferase [Gammaproteobacteria bacterium]MBU1982678.1 GNAT family N-acetyltransferase [Gammaproteobacteria bacterium]